MNRNLPTIKEEGENSDNDSVSSNNACCSDRSFDDSLSSDGKSTGSRDGSKTPELLTSYLDELNRRFSIERTSIDSQQSIDSQKSMDSRKSMDSQKSMDSRKSMDSQKSSGLFQDESLLGLVYNGFSSKNKISNSGSDFYPTNQIAPNDQHSPGNQNSYPPSVNPQSPRGATSLLGFISRGFC